MRAQIAVLLIVIVVAALCWSIDAAGAVNAGKAKKTASENDDNVETISSNSALSDRIKDLSKAAKLSDELTSEEKLKLRKDELRIRLTEEDIVAKFGKVSLEYADYLHKLGGNLHKQQDFEQSYVISKQIVEIHEKLDGPESENTARALGNLGSASFRLNRARECEVAMNRALYIWLERYGENSKEVLLHRGKMLTFQVPFAKTSMGLSYDDYVFNEL